MKVGYGCGGSARGAAWGAIWVVRVRGVGSRVDDGELCRGCFACE